MAVESESCSLLTGWPSGSSGMFSSAGRKSSTALVYQNSQREGKQRATWAQQVLWRALLSFFSPPSWLADSPPVLLVVVVPVVHSDGAIYRGSRGERAPKKCSTIRGQLPRFPTIWTVTGPITRAVVTEARVSTHAPWCWDAAGHHQSCVQNLKLCLF